MPNDIQQLHKEIASLRRQLSALYAAATLPFPVESAFRTRLNLNRFAVLTDSSKSASSENQAVDEAGAGSYSVLKPPDGFEERTVNGQTRYYPYWT